MARQTGSETNWKGEKHFDINESQAQEYRLPNNLAQVIVLDVAKEMKTVTLNCL